MLVTARGHGSDGAPRMYMTLAARLETQAWRDERIVLEIELPPRGLAALTGGLAPA